MIFIILQQMNQIVYKFTHNFFFFFNTFFQYTSDRQFSRTLEDGNITSDRTVNFFLLFFIRKRYHLSKRTGAQ